MSETIEKRLNKFRWESGRRSHSSDRVLRAMYADAMKAHSNGDYDLAIDLVRSQNDWSENSQAQRILGHALFAKGNVHEAVDAYRCAFLINQNDPISAADDKINEAAALANLNDYTAAKDALDEALILRPGYDVARIGIIGLFNRQELWHELELFLVSQIKDEPTFATNQKLVEHLNNDTDFIGVRAIIERIQNEEKDA